MLYTIDPISSMILGGFGALIAAGLLKLARSLKPHVRHGCRQLARGQLLMGAGMCSYLFAPLLPDGVPYLMLVHGVLAGHFLWGLGLRSMVDAAPMARPLRWAFVVALAGLPVAAIVGGKALDLYYPASIAASMILFSIDLRSEFRSRQPDAKFNRLNVILHFFIGSLIVGWALRVWGAWIHVGPPDPIGLYLPLGGEELTLMIYGVGPLAFAVQILLLINYRTVAELRDQALVDSLTGIASRRGLTDAWPGIERRAREGGRVIAVALFDLDRFKAVNDTYGHLVGDDALRHVVSVAGGVLRPGDHFSRYGGEEFLLLLPVRDLREAGGVAERVRAVIEAAPCHVGRLDLPLTVSVGVTLRDPDEPLPAAIARADRRLYQAKAAGRNRVVAEDTVEVD